MSCLSLSLRPSLRVAAALFVCGLIAGCGGGQPVPKPADSSKAVEALRTTLEAWKSGQKPEALAAEQYRIHVADQDWNAGYKLTDFTISGSAPLMGVTVRCPVALSLQSPEGESLQKDVLYAVGTDPIISVVRQDDDN